MVSISSFPASILERSRISFISESRDLAASCNRVIWLRCCSVRLLSSNRSAKPITPFIGVRISWLMLARKADLVRLAASAVLRACSRLSSASLRSVMSKLTPINRPPRPIGSRLRLAAAFVCLTRPSGRTIRYSLSKPRVPAAAARISSSTLARSSACTYLNPSGLIVPLYCGLRPRV